MSGLESSVVLDARASFEKDYSAKIEALGYRLDSKVIFHRRNFCLLALVSDYSGTISKERKKQISAILPEEYRYKDCSIPIVLEFETHPVFFKKV